VTMRDFSFAPATVSVEVGDPVTWSNSGRTQHTATANDGSFDTGTVASGASGSASFRRAGSFGYVCSLHPQMTGTVRVAAADTGSGEGGSGSTGSDGGSTGSSAGGSPADAGNDGGASLPNSGGEAERLAVLGLLMLAVGIAARLGPARRRG
jgi:hypothetical protein